MNKSYFMEEQNVNIRWPKDQPLDVNMSNPVGLKMFNSQDTPLHLNMGITDGKVIPVCIKLCEPICAESSYKIGINLMGQSFAEIQISGITRIFNCRDKGNGDVIK